MSKVKIRLLRATGMGLEGVGVPGQEFDVSQELAQQLVGDGRAEHVKGTLYEASKADDEAKAEDEAEVKAEKATKAKRKRKAKKAADAKAEAEETDEEEEEEEEKEEEFVVETATTKPAEKATWPNY